MKVTRLGPARHLHKEVEIVDIEIGDQKFRLTETIDGHLAINLSGDGIVVKPMYANVIEVFEEPK